LSSFYATFTQGRLTIKGDLYFFLVIIPASQKIAEARNAAICAFCKSCSNVSSFARRQCFYV